MLRVTLWEVRAEKNVGQSSLSKSGEISRVDAVLELGPSVSARSDHIREDSWLKIKKAT